MNDQEVRRPKSPCYKCPDRWAECHATCERYKQYVKENDAFKEAVNQIKDNPFKVRGEWSKTTRKQLTGKGRKQR